jgi:hypothetical protein
MWLWRTGSQLLRASLLVGGGGSDEVGGGAEGEGRGRGSLLCATCFVKAAATLTAPIGPWHVS